MKRTGLKPTLNIFICLLIILSANGGVVFAADTSPSDGGPAANLAWQKQVLTALADVAIKNLDAAETTVQANPVLSSSTKQAVLASLQGVEDQLISYKAQIVQAKTVAEVQTLNQQIGQYLKANKTVIIDSFKLAFTEIGNAAVAKAKQLEATLRTTLTLLKTLCPQQTATISTLETQLNTLNANLVALNAAIQARDVATILHKMNEISILIQSMNTNVKTIQTECQISPSGTTPTPVPSTKTGATPTSTSLPQNTGISKCPAGLKNSISTTTGCVQGTYDSATNREMFLGIPYAEPPVGDLRWKRPKIKTAWTTTLVAQKSSSACMQQGQGYLNSLPGFGVTGPQSEDCLYLDMWRPAKQKGPLPILFWIYGGGYVAGSGSSSMYAPNPDLANNAIVVTFNYRLGTLGFLAHPDLSAENTLNISGNYGLYDIIEALKWVNINAESLGGSRNQITIFGQSAGGNAIVSLLKTDIVAGLYTSAVAQSNTAIVGSASPRRGVPLKSGEEMGLKMSQTIGCSPAPSGMTVLQCLRKKTSQELTKAWTTVNQGNNDVTPYADGIIGAGSYQRVPLVMGMTTEEYATLSKAIGILKTRAQFEEQLRKEGAQMGVTDLDGLVNIYLPPNIGNDGQSIAEAFANYSWDTQFYCGARVFLKNYATKTGMPTYGYLYSHAPSFFPAALGAQHGSELFFLFGSTVWKPKFQTQERDMATNLQKAWTSFAKGAPVVEGVGAWPKFDQGNFVKFDLKSSVTSGIHLNQCDFLESQGIYRL